MSVLGVSAAAVVVISSYWLLTNRFEVEGIRSTSLQHFILTSWKENSELVVVCALVFAVLLLLYKLWTKSSSSGKRFATKNHEKQIGYLLTTGRSKREIANILRQVKRAGEVPPMYPNSWYEVMRSEDLAIGEVKAVSMLGKHLVVFRNEKGNVCIMDGYCPHLGANLGVGGRVKGDCIVCPFHGWEFNGETGKCEHIPYTDKVPAFAKTNVWNSIERNGLILVWFDAEGREPPYFIEDIPQITSGKWKYRGYCVHYINAHLQDVCENAADGAHFKTIHGPAIGGGSSLKYLDASKNCINRLLQVNLKINWESLPPPNTHIGRSTVDSYYTLFKKWRLPIEVHAALNQIGPGYLFTTVKLPFAEGVFIQTFVPEGPMTIRMASHLYFDWWVPNFIANHVLQEIATQVDRDSMIWNNKTYHPRPLLLKEEEGIRNFRKWFSQFYSENSPTFDLKESSDTLIW